MAEFQTYLQQALDFARDGYGTVNVRLGLLIALIAAFLAKDYRHVFVVAIGAALVTVVAEALLPFFANTGPLRLPAVLEPVFWRHLAYLLVGNIIVILLLYSLRRVLLKGGH